MVSPDAGRVRVAERWTDRLGGARWRSSTSAATRSVPNQVKVHEVVGEVEGRICLIVDDMIDTGGTIVKAAEALHENGAADVDRRRDPRRAVRPGRRAAARTAAITEVVVTNTLPIPAERSFDKLTVLSIAPLIARAIREVFDDGSVTSLFDGNA